MGSSLVISASRQVWAFSRDGAMPFSRYIRPVTKDGTPVRAVWACSLLAALMGLLVLINSTTASALFSLLVAGCYTAYFVPVASRLLWGQDKFVPGPFYTGPIFSKIIEVFMFVVFLFPNAGPSPTARTMNYACAIYGFVIIATVFYWYLPKIGARLWFKGPRNHREEAYEGESPDDESATGIQASIKISNAGSSGSKTGNVSAGGLMKSAS